MRPEFYDEQVQRLLDLVCAPPDAPTTTQQGGFQGQGVS